MNFKLENLDWVTYQKQVSNGGKKIVIPVGAIEQHGPHMSLNPDVLIPEYIGLKVAEKAKSMLVAPAISYGYKSQVKSGGGNFFPGTTCVSSQSLEQYVYDVILAFTNHGNREFILINGHFENSMCLVEAADRAVNYAKLSGVDIKIILLSYWDFISEDTIKKVFPDGFSGWAVEHGGVLETSIMLKIHPELVDMSKVVDIAPAEFPPYDVFPPDTSWVPESGTLSSPAKATVEKGELILEECITRIAETVG